MKKSLGTSREDYIKEVERNYDAMQSRLPELIKNNNIKGKYALMQKERIKGYYNSFDEALFAGNKKYQDQPFSIQKVTNEPLQLC